jgi:galactose mutarotase-like enzyme
MTRTGLFRRTYPIAHRSYLAYPRNHNAISIETEHYPDAPSHPNFPSTEATPDKPLHEITEYRFSSK